MLVDTLMAQPEFAILLGGTAGLQSNFVCRKTLQSCRPEGQSNFLGTEWDLGLTYSLAGAILRLGVRLHTGR
jgi:hypothetical protein